MKLNEVISSAEVAVTDLSGEMMLTQAIDQLTTVDVSHLAQGSYIVSIISNEAPIAKQVVVKQ